MRWLFDIVVVGAGPAGSVAAREAARWGRGSVLLVDRSEFPRPKTCAGGLSARSCRLLKELRLWKRVRPDGYPIRSVRVVLPRGGALLVPAAGAALVVDRERFDHTLVRAAIQDGVEFRPRTKVDRLLWADGHAVGVGAGALRIRARWTIIATGADNMLQKAARTERLTHTCVARFEGVSTAPNVCEFVYDSELFPYYGWLFPESDTRANVGICAEAARLRGRSIRDVFAHFLDRYYAASLKRAKQIGRLRGAAIATGGRLTHSAPPGVLLAGEADRLANVATGEGISYAMESGRLAARAIRSADESGLGPAQTGRLYAASLRRVLALRFRAAWLYRKIGVSLLSAASALPCRGTLARLVGRALSLI